MSHLDRPLLFESMSTFEEIGVLVEKMRSVGDAHKKLEEANAEIRALTIKLNEAQEATRQVKLDYKELLDDQANETAYLSRENVKLAKMCRELGRKEQELHLLLGTGRSNVKTEPSVYAAHLDLVNVSLDLHSRSGSLLRAMKRINELNEQVKDLTAKLGAPAASTSTSSESVTECEVLGAVGPPPSKRAAPAVEPSAKRARYERAVRAELALDKRCESKGETDGQEQCNK